MTTDTALLDKARNRLQYQESNTQLRVELYTATKRILDLEAKVAALTTVAEDAKALAKQPMGLRLNAREFATLLASLRSWQMELSELSSNEIAEMNTDIHFSGIEGGPLSSEEIDNLCERLNCGAES